MEKSEKARAVKLKELQKKNNNKITDEVVSIYLSRTLKVPSGKNDHSSLVTAARVNIYGEKE